MGSIMDKSSNLLLIRIRMTVRYLAMRVLPSPQRVVVSLNLQPPIKLEMFPPTEAESIRGFDQANAFVTATAEFDVSSRSMDLLRSLKEKRERGIILRIGAPPDEPEKDNEVDLSKILDDQFYHEIRPHVQHLSTSARRFMMILLWREDLDLGHNPLSVCDSEWSENGIEWTLLPSEGWRAYVVGGTRSSRFDRDVLEQVCQLVNRGLDAPVHFLMLREANELSIRNWRTALVIGVASVEVAAKSCIIRLLPATEWLMRNIDSPPVAKIVKKFLPEQAGKRRIDLPKRLMKSLQTAVEERNQIVHNGVTSLDTDQVIAILCDLGDINWILDYMGGEDWAIKHVSSATAEDLKKSM